MKKIVILFLVGYALIIVTRLPQLLSSNFTLDGDECILGLMAKHIKECKKISVFFYGQNYGFSLVETGCAAIGFHFFGVSDKTLKLSMLFLWSIGCVFLYFATKRWFGSTVGILTLLLIVFLPAWASCSMKAWGYYVSSFLFFNLSLFLLSFLKSHTKFSNSLWFLLGICCAIIFYSQPIWLICTIPFIVYVLLKNNKLTNIIFISLGFILVVFIIDFMLVSQKNAYWSVSPIGKTNLLRALWNFPERLKINLSGAYFLSTKHYIGLFSEISGITWTSIFFILAVVQFGRLVTRRFSLPSHLIFVSLLGVIVFSLFIKEPFFGYRYLLPFSELLVVLLVFELTELSKFKKHFKSYCYITIVFLLIMGTFSLFEFKNFFERSVYPDASIDEPKQTMKLIDELNKHNTHFVYCLDPLLQWNIMFYSKEKIICRWFHPVDRYPKYPQSVDLALLENKPVAIVGLSKQVKDVYLIFNKYKNIPLTFSFIDNKYFIFFNPDIRILSKLGFKFFINRK